MIVRCNRSHPARRLVGGAITWAAVCSVLWACAPNPLGWFKGHVGPDLAPDSSVVILHVVNYQPDAVVVLLEADTLVRRVGMVHGRAWSYFVLTDAMLGAIREFVVLVVSARRAVVAYQSERITHDPGELLLMTIAAGREPHGAAVYTASVNSAHR